MCYNFLSVVFFVSRAHVSLLFSFYFYSSIGTNCLSWKQVLYVPFKEVVHCPFFRSTAKVFTFSSRTLIVLHNDFFPGSTFPFELADDTLKSRESKKIHASERANESVNEWVSWRAWEKDRMIKRKKERRKKRPKTETNSYSYSTWAFFLVIFFRSHLLYLNWSVSTFFLVWTFQFSAYFMSSFSIINHCECVWFFFSIRMRLRLLLLPHLLAVIFLCQTNIPVKNEISSFQIHWHAYKGQTSVSAHAPARTHTHV